MQQQLKIALVQTHLIWENPVANRTNIQEKLDNFKDNVDLIILPEMFTTGFSMNPNPYAETLQGKTLSWLKEITLKRNTAVCGSLMITENNNYYNRFVFVTPQCDVYYYNKRHTFNMAGEGEIYTPGDTPVVIDYLGWKLALQVCYDLRFPVFARNISGYDALLYVANWPKTRINAWDTLLKARGIENMCYAIGVNRVGLDGNNLEYTGHSAVYNVLGDQLAFAKTKETILTATLDKHHLSQTRARLPFLEDKDDFKLL